MVTISQSNWRLLNFFSIRIQGTAGSWHEKSVIKRQLVSLFNIYLIELRFYKCANVMCLATHWFLITNAMFLFLFLFSCLKHNSVVAVKIRQVFIYFHWSFIYLLVFVAGFTVDRLSRFCQTKTDQRWHSFWHANP